MVICWANSIFRIVTVLNWIQFRDNWSEWGGNDASKKCPTCYALTPFLWFFWHLSIAVSLGFIQVVRMLKEMVSRPPFPSSLRQIGLETNFNGFLVQFIDYCLWLGSYEYYIIEPMTWAMRRWFKNFPLILMTISLQFNFLKIFSLAVVFLLLFRLLPSRLSLEINFECITIRSKIRTPSGYLALLKKVLSRMNFEFSINKSVSKMRPGSDLLVIWQTNLHISLYT